MSRAVPAALGSSSMVVGSLVAGIAIEIVAVAVLARDYRFRARAIRVEGVVSSHRSQSSGARKIHAPVVDYEVGGKTHRFESGTFGSGCPAIGEKVTLFVDPNSPADAALDGHTGIAITARVLLLVGAFTLLFGLFGHVSETP